jgi:hypothetical protein
MLRSSHPKAKEAITLPKHEASCIRPSGHQGLQRHHTSHAVAGQRNVFRSMGQKAVGQTEITIRYEIFDEIGSCNVSSFSPVRLL